MWLHTCTNLLVTHHHNELAYKAQDYPRRQRKMLLDRKLFRGICGSWQYRVTIQLAVPVAIGPEVQSRQPPDPPQGNRYQRLQPCINLQSAGNYAARREWTQNVDLESSTCLKSSLLSRPMSLTYRVMFPWGSSVKRNRFGILSDPYQGESHVPLQNHHGHLDARRR